MARISVFENEKTVFSQDKIDILCYKVSELSIDEIEKFQTENGISNRMLAKLAGVNESTISRWKGKKGDLPDAARTAIFFAISFADHWLR